MIFICVTFKSQIYSFFSLWLGRNRYVCGDNKIYPSTLFQADNAGNPFYANGSIEAFLNADQLGV